MQSSPSPTLSVLVLSLPTFVFSDELASSPGQPRIFPGSFFPLPSMKGLFSGLGEAGRVAAVMARDASDAWEAVQDKRVEESAGGYGGYER